MAVCQQARPPAGSETRAPAGRQSAGWPASSQPLLAGVVSLLAVHKPAERLGDGETGYVKVYEVQGSSFNKVDKVMYQGREMIVSKGKDSVGDIKMRPAQPDLSGVKAIADALCVSGVLTSVRRGLHRSARVSPSGSASPSASPSHCPPAPAREHAIPPPGGRHAGARAAAGLWGRRCPAAIRPEAIYHTGWA